MNETRTIYAPCSQGPAVYQKNLTRLENSKIGQDNIKVIKQFANHMFATTSKHARISKLILQLRKICETISPQLLISLTKDEMSQIIGAINQHPKQTEATKNDYRRAIKQFFKWYEEEDPRLNSQDKQIREQAQKFYKYTHKDIRVTYKEKQASFDTIITDEKIEHILKTGCRILKEIAFISSFDESGCRIGEFLPIKLGAIEKGKEFWTLWVDGKTGKRGVPVLKSIKHLTAYIETLPTTNADQYLWPPELKGNNKKYLNEPRPLMHCGAQRLVNACFERAGLKNTKHNLHWFRHSRATKLAPKIAESMLCKIMGWTLGSKQVRRYCHLSTDQVKDALADAYGIERPKKDQTGTNPCARCNTINERKSTYCWKCGNPLTMEQALADKEEMDRQRSEMYKFYSYIQADPELKEAFEKFKTRLKEIL